MHSLVLLGLSLAAFIPTVRSESSFSQPPGPGPAGNYRDNPTYEVGEKIDIQWSSDLETMDLLLWQEYPGAGDSSSFFDRLLVDTRSTSLIWTVSFNGFSTDVADGESAIFYLALYEGGTNTIDITCHYFNVTVPTAETTTASTATTVSTNVSTGKPTPESDTTTTESSTKTSTSNSESTSDSNSDSGLSTGAVAGIAVGATLGGVLALGGLGFLIWKYFIRKRDPSGQYTQGQQVPPEDNKPELAGADWIHPPQGEPRTQGPGGLYEAP
ncbi:hypothetical protein BKA56DRAFT_579176 [Ilyonectria sp. MPI-CAGE-AT-0026]|nr:hypothetical protein BKA56DRAFT_579176 [Ilyonectria sp. MPI-CAGE-AT-0026]